MRQFSLGDFDFALPPELIAQHPAAERSASRLLDGTGDAPVDRIFRELPALLAPGDLLVFNDTQVVKARLYGEKPTGGKLELLAESGDFFKAHALDYRDGARYPRLERKGGAPDLLAEVVKPAAPGK